MSRILRVASFLFACALILGLAAGCSSSSSKSSKAQGSTTSSSGGAAGTPFCKTLHGFKDYNDQTGQAILAGGDWSTVKKRILALIDKGLATYDEAVKEAPADLRGDLATLRDFTKSFRSTAEGATSATDLASKAQAAPGVAQAGQAGVHLNQYAVKSCGFSVSPSSAG